MGKGDEVEEVEVVWEEEYEVYFVCHTCRKYEFIGMIEIRDGFFYPPDKYDMEDFFLFVWEHKGHEVGVILVPPGNIEELKKKGYTKIYAYKMSEEEMRQIKELWKKAAEEMERRGEWKKYRRMWGCKDYDC